MSKLQCSVFSRFFFFFVLPFISMIKIYSELEKCYEINDWGTKDWQVQSAQKIQHEMCDVLACWASLTLVTASRVSIVRKCHNARRQCASTSPSCQPFYYCMFIFVIIILRQVIDDRIFAAKLHLYVPNKTRLSSHLFSKIVYFLIFVSKFDSEHVSSLSLWKERTKEEKKYCFVSRWIGRRIFFSAVAVIDSCVCLFTLAVRTKRA